MRQARPRRAPLLAALVVGALAPACGHQRAAPAPAPAMTRVSPEEARALPVDRGGADSCGPFFGGPYPGVRRVLADGRPVDEPPPIAPARPVGAPLSPEFVELDHWF